MELCNEIVIQGLLERHGFRFSRSMGQNFLIDPSIPPPLRRRPGRTRAAACWRSARASAR